MLIKSTQDGLRRFIYSSPPHYPNNTGTVIAIYG